MMTIEKDTIRQTIELSKLEYSDAKEQELIKEMQKIITFVEQLDSVDVSGVKPTYNGIDLHSVLREDKAVKSDRTDQLIENAPTSKDDYIQVPSVMDKEGGDA